MKKLVVAMAIFFCASTAHAQLLNEIHASEWSRMTSIGAKPTIFEGHLGGAIYLEQTVSIFEIGLAVGYNVESSHGYTQLYAGLHLPIGIHDVYINGGFPTIYGGDDTWFDIGKVVEIGYRARVNEYLGVGIGHEWRWVDDNRDAMFFLNISYSRYNLI